MSERRIVIYLSFSLVFILTIIAALLIFFERGGAAQFDLFGHQFSSTNIGLAVLFLAVMIFLGIIKSVGFGAKPDNVGERIFTSSDEAGQVSWNELIDSIQKLVLRLTAADGFRPDLVIGICGGGLVVADIVAKRLGHIPCLGLWPDRHSGAEKSFLDGEAADINKMDLNAIIDGNAVRRILIVDDVVYGGSTMEAALKFVNEKCESVRSGKTLVKTAAVFALREASFQPDFVVIVDSRNRRMMPASDRLR